MDVKSMKEKIQANTAFNPKQQFDKNWILTGINEKAILYAENFGFYLCDIYENKYFDKKTQKEVIEFKPGKKALTNSQIRNVFGEVKRIQMKISGNEKKWAEVKSAFLLLQPKLAYASGRVESKTRGATLVDLKDVLFEAAKAVSADSEGAVGRYINFVDFLESILAYHKAYGGKDN